MTKEERRLKFVSEHPEYSENYEEYLNSEKYRQERAVKAAEAEVVLEINVPKHLMPKIEKKPLIRPKIIKPGFCGFCEMRLSGIHKEFPCKESLVDLNL